MRLQPVALAAEFRRVFAVNSSLVARKILVRKHWSSVRQLSSPGSAERSELMLCVATIGISRACRDSANVRSSPVGSVSPTVAKAWYSSQTKSRSRQTLVGLRRDLRNALQDGALEIQLQHHAQDAGQPRIHRRPESSERGRGPSRAASSSGGERPRLARFAAAPSTQFAAGRTPGARRGCRRTATGTRRRPR